MNIAGRIIPGLGAGALAAGLLFLPSHALAQRPEPGPPPPGLNEDESAREELGETIEIYMLARLKRTLKLTDEQERKVIPLVEELNATRRDTHRGHRLTMMKLRPLVEDETAKDSELLALIDHLEELESRLRQKEQATRAELRSLLTPRQQALYVMFQERFRHEMEERLRRLQRGDDGPGPGGMGGNPPPPGRPRPWR